MKISTRGRYGIRLMLALALNYNNGTIPLKTIAKDQGISEKYLEQIINPLTKSGLVKSFRGAQGGYMLTNPPEATTVGEILRVLEGSLSPVDCVDHPNCANSDHCVSLSIWKKMKVALDEVVDNITLADMAAEYAEKIPMWQQSSAVTAENIKASSKIKCCLQIFLCRQHFLIPLL